MTFVVAQKNCALFFQGMRGKSPILKYARWTNEVAPWRARAARDRAGWPLHGVALRRQEVLVHQAHPDRHGPTRRGLL